ncbi:Com family DNA-binding transcriptional regulator [Salmonella enterica subsp. enterica serovar Newport]|nr:Com family DNA-binding transcriptional regulator [Salmonella enterica]ECO1580714.1 Com family DNA-binding transcriptional regulator [Salmonella enterica subsp. enterica serovar Newport]ECO1599034.1 Com family DNA-binding transcriptional regulator [Salmonella enterica subsp. enterica serovar Newport]ECW5976716.1 Com family DNA-binding transcriptional regulator [Salmonella enterica subsp. enterica serovar Newport]
MHSIRCKNCNKLLFKGDFLQVEIKCPRCKRYILISNAFEHPTEIHCGKTKKITHSDKTLHYCSMTVRS